MIILKVCAAGVTLAVLAFLLSELGFGGKKIFTVLSIVAILSFVTEGLSSIVGEVGAIAELGGVSESARCAMKILFLGYVFGISSEICTELGEGGIARVMTIVGKTEIILVILPYVRDIVNLGVSLIK